eukprot:6193757-Pleurochrysis_carterae.AAC.1
MAGALDVSPSRAACLLEMTNAHWAPLERVRAPLPSKTESDKGHPTKPSWKRQRPLKDCAL